MAVRSFAMILDNPGEQPQQTRYRDPGELRRLGYTDLIVYPTTGLSGLLGADTLSAADVREWVTDQYEHVRRTASEARDAGLGVWLVYDAPSLAAELVGSAMTCVGHRPAVLCPGSTELLEMSGQCLKALLSAAAPVDGVVLRLGDNDAAKVGYLVGNDLYSPYCARCGGIDAADRLERYIRFFYELVVGELDRELIVRAWNLRPGGMHDDPELCRRVVERLPSDDRLIYSFKFTHTDFWRYQRWNPSSLVCGDRPVIYELQCQREFEAKGAVPNYQPPLWRDGMPEVGESMGLADAAGRVKLHGLWAWVRGGGWRGPYVNRQTETWIDANVMAVPRLAADPAADVRKLAEEWIERRLEVTAPETAEAIRGVLEHSTQVVLQTFYVGPYARNRDEPWYPSADFIQDDQIDAEALWALLRRLPDNVLNDVASEKAAAQQQLAADRQALHRVADRLDHSAQHTLPLSLEYAETLVQTLRHLIEGMIAYRRWLRRPDASLAQAAEQSMRASQSGWIHHTQRIAARGGPSAFVSDNLWDFTQQVIDRLNE